MRKKVKPKRNRRVELAADNLDLQNRLDISMQTSERSLRAAEEATRLVRHLEQHNQELLTVVKALVTIVENSRPRIVLTHHVNE